MCLISFAGLESCSSRRMPAKSESAAVLVGAGDIADCRDLSGGEAGGCDAGSPQGNWLREYLAAHPAACTLAYFHKPLFSSGGAHGDDLTVKPLWDALYGANADVIVSGHDHDYERFAPQTPEAN